MNTYELLAVQKHYGITGKQVGTPTAYGFGHFYKKSMIESNNLQGLFGTISSNYFDNVKLAVPYASIAEGTPMNNKAIRLLPYNNGKYNEVTSKVAKAIRNLIKYNGFDESLYDDAIYGSLTEQDSNLLIFDIDKIHTSVLGLSHLTEFPDMQLVGHTIANHMPEVYRNIPMMVFPSSTYGFGKFSDTISVRVIIPLRNKITIAAGRHIVDTINDHFMKNYGSILIDPSMFTNYTKAIQIGINDAHKSNHYRDQVGALINADNEPPLTEYNYNHLVASKGNSISLGNRKPFHEVFEYYTDDVLTLLDNAKLVTENMDMNSFYFTYNAFKLGFTKKEYALLVESLRESPRGQSDEWYDKLDERVDQIYEELVATKKVYKKRRAAYRGISFKAEKLKHSLHNEFKKRYPQQYFDINEQFIPKNKVELLLSMDNDTKQNVAISSNMKTGKTTAFGELIEKAFERGYKVFIIASRVALIRELYKNLGIEGVTITSDKSISDNSLVVNSHMVITTINSCHKYMSDVTEKTLVLFDEFDESIQQLNGTITNGTDFAKGYKAFINLLKIANKTAFAQHNLSTQLLTVIKHAGLEDKTKLLHNKYKPMEGITWYSKHYDKLTDAGKYAVNVASSVLANNSKFLLSTNNKDRAVAIYKELSDLFPSKKGLLLSADTIMLKESTEFLMDIEKGQKKYDYIIITPVITTGISFNDRDYETSIMLHSNSDKGGTIDGTLQGVHRNRVAKQVIGITAQVESFEPMALVNQSKVFAENNLEYEKLKDYINDLSIGSNTYNVQYNADELFIIQEIRSSVRAHIEYQRYFSRWIAIEAAKTMGYKFIEGELPIDKAVKGRHTTYYKKVTDEKRRNIVNAYKEAQVPETIEEMKNALNDPNNNLTALMEKLYFSLIRYDIEDFNSWSPDKREEFAKLDIYDTTAQAVKSLYYMTLSEADWEIHMKSRSIATVKGYISIEELRAQKYTREFYKYIGLSVGMSSKERNIFSTRCEYQPKYLVEEINNKYQLQNTEKREQLIGIPLYCDGNSVMKRTLTSDKLNKAFEAMGLERGRTKQSQKHVDKHVDNKKGRANVYFVSEMVPLIRELANSYIKKQIKLAEETIASEEAADDLMNLITF